MGEVEKLEDEEFFENEQRKFLENKSIALGLGWTYTKFKNDRRIAKYLDDHSGEDRETLLIVLYMDFSEYLTLFKPSTLKGFMDWLALAEADGPGLNI